MRRLKEPFFRNGMLRMTKPLAVPYVRPRQMASFNHPLFGLREHRRNLARREAQGESLWSKYLNEQVRIKFAHAIADLAQEHRDSFDPTNPHRDLSDALDGAVRTVCSQLGIVALPNQQRWPATQKAVLDTVVDKRTDEALVFSLVEAIWQTTASFTYPPSGPFPRIDPRQEFGASIRTMLEDHRVAFDFIEGRFVARGEQIMHRSVVVPTLSLLSGRRDLRTTERHYLDALKSIQEHRYDDAITDACTTLESALAALGCEGNTLGKRFHNAVALGIATSYDKSLVNWLVSDRGAKSDAHPEGIATTRADAWLSVHVIGAFILCLTEAQGRGTQKA